MMLAQSCPDLHLADRVNDDPLPLPLAQGSDALELPPLQLSQDAVHHCADGGSARQAVHSLLITNHTL